MQERPIIVRFVRRDTKIDMMRKKKTLRTIDRYRNTFVNDDLTPLRSKMLRALKHDEEVKRVWTIDGSFHCIVMEGNVEVKKRLDSPDDLFKLGWSGRRWRTLASSPTTRNCATIQSPPDGYHCLDIMDFIIFYYLSLSSNLAYWASLVGTHLYIAYSNCRPLPVTYYACFIQ